MAGSATAIFAAPKLHLQLQLTSREGGVRSSTTTGLSAFPSAAANSRGNYGRASNKLVIRNANAEAVIIKPRGQLLPSSSDLCDHGS
eukprot:5365854-Pleurochrysis_carterae.AAC.4